MHNVHYIIYASFPWKVHIHYPDGNTETRTPPKLLNNNDISYHVHAEKYIIYVHVQAKLLQNMLMLKSSSVCTVIVRGQMFII